MSIRYEVGVTTAQELLGGSLDRLSLSLVGSLASTPSTRLKWLIGKTYFKAGSTQNFEVSSDTDLGEIVLLRVHKKRNRFVLMEDSWKCSHLTVKAPGHSLYTFPAHSWLTDENTLHVAEGTARRRNQYKSEILEQHWRDEIKARQADYLWDSYLPDIPKSINASKPHELPLNAQFTARRQIDFLFDLDNLVPSFGFNKNDIFPNKSFSGLGQIQQICCRRTTPTSVYVVKHWKEESFFGYQFLNGSNPVLIKQCLQLPPSLPLTDSMVSPSLGSHTSLQQQLQAGNVYIVDYEILKGIPAHSIAGHPQYLSAPICLLHLTPSGQLIPIAIQLNQEPGDHNPIFLPSDPKYVWRLAKIWVRHADVQVHQLVSHLLRTHLISEVFCVATMRTLPDAHPLFKLLMPHVKYTLHINTLARKLLISEGGVFDQAFSTGGQAKAQLLQRATERITFPSLCLPEELATRGVEKLPNYYYRDDGLRVWAAINSFVEEIVQMYYEDDVSVGDDTDVQAFAREIFTEGFLSRSSSGFPTSLTTRPDLIKFLTMIIFTCSAQHSAVNGGQFDWGSWMPNNPSTMRRPPPTDKSDVSKHDIWATLPPTTATVTVLLTTYSLSQPAPSQASLGVYSEVRFTEPGPQQSIEKFLDRLKLIKAAIDQRNQGLDLPYTYLRPDLIENSVAI